MAVLQSEPPRGEGWGGNDVLRRIASARGGGTAGRFGSKENLQGGQKKKKPKRYVMILTGSITPGRERRGE